MTIDRLLMKNVLTCNQMVLSLKKKFKLLERGVQGEKKENAAE